MNDTVAYALDADGTVLQGQILWRTESRVCLGGVEAGKNGIPQNPPAGLRRLEGAASLVLPAANLLALSR